MSEDPVVAILRRALVLVADGVGKMHVAAVRGPRARPATPVPFRAPEADVFSVVGAVWRAAADLRANTDHMHAALAELEVAMCDPRPFNPVRILVRWATPEATTAERVRGLFQIAIERRLAGANGGRHVE